MSGNQGWCNLFDGDAGLILSAAVTLIAIGLGGENAAFVMLITVCFGVNIRCC